MIKDRRYTGNIIYIDFYAKETFQNYPAEQSLTITLATDGEWNFTLNRNDYRTKDPFILCLNESDQFLIKSTGNYAAKSFCFRPLFINSRLTPDAMIHNTLENTEDMHDRNLMDIFMKRNEHYHMWDLSRRIPEKTQKIETDHTDKTALRHQIAVLRRRACRSEYRF